MLMETQSIETPEFPRLCGEEAIEALCCHILELEEQRGKELTDKQTTALIKLTKRLISSIEADTRLGGRAQRNVDSDLGKWLLCRLMRKEGHSGTDIAKHMK